MKKHYKIIGPNYLINIIVVQLVENTKIGDVNQQHVNPKHVIIFKIIINYKGYQ
jgi:hypothetical protein